MDMLNQKQKIIIGAIIAIAIGIILFQYINSTKEVYTYEENSFIEAQVEENKKEEEKIIIHVTGSVKKNGIVKVNENARINDVIEAAGGVTDDADLSDVNLAYMVEDGQKIYIPSKKDKIDAQSNTQNTNDLKEKELEIISNGAGENVTEGSKEGSGKITNINKASLEGLKSLPGIGESTALKILEYRETHGKFKTIEDLKNVSGIGEAKFNTIKLLICV